MDEQTIAALVKQIQEAKMPEWRTSLSGQIAYNLQVHTKGLIFDKVTGLFPNEHPESQKHCINSYEPITTGSIWKAINNIIRVFNNSSYNIQISDKTRETIEKYQDSQGSFFSQFLEDWIKNAVATDPNGLCVWYPLDYTDDLYRYVCYKDLISISDDTLIFVSAYESETKTEIVDRVMIKEVFHDYDFLDGAPNVRHGIERTYHPQLAKKIINHVYHVFTLTHFIRFYKDNPGDKEFKFDFYAHPKPLETLPYFENGGIEVEDGIYKSFVQEFVPFGNMALLAHRNQRAVELMHYFPKMSEVQQACDECYGKGETTCVKTDENPTGWTQCKRCKGSKYVTIQSPYKVYRKVPNENFDVTQETFRAPSVEYYTPPTGILEIVQKQWGFYVGQAEESVYVQRKVDTGNVESAEKKRIDQEGMHSWLANIAKVLYGNLQMGVQYLENYVNPSPITVSVEQPYSFAVLTETEAFEALNTMLMSSTPAPIKGNQVDTFVNKFISDSSPVKRALQILEKFDLLLYYSNDEVSNFKGNSWVDSKMCQLHVLAYPLLKKMYKLDSGLFDLEDDAIITKLTTEVAKYDLTKDLRTSVLAIQPTNGTEIPTS